MKQPDDYKVGQRVKVRNPKKFMSILTDYDEGGVLQGFRMKRPYGTVTKIKRDSVIVLLDSNKEEHAFEAGYLLPLSYIRERFGK